MATGRSSIGGGGVACLESTAAWIETAATNDDLSVASIGQRGNLNVFVIQFILVTFLEVGLEKYYYIHTIGPSFMAIECLVLGAGQEVGKSCVVVTINGKRIIFDCGMHTGHQDEHRYPNFSMISKSDDDFKNSLSCIIISHFHLDHIGALPYFTQVCGYNGPIYMTQYPTKTLAPLMLEDYRKVMVDRRGEIEQFSSEDIVEVTAVDLKQTVQVDKDLQIRAYYAGHSILSRLSFLYFALP
ncbi:cleavage and polyadenylation specificity factor subunit 3-ii [Phtheirospermum japonicum]|uniref:Cleavage and polyadenylation specificity factor subunit 3-ii n=1 Tax=Phtheirospermum japonicum TaxID=374723 RepID=A0A830B118_9LAMI|nr:cleavage and polyadenylation specificity factor subunit 3-ii [Phtheirospermum japonicum]